MINCFVTDLDGTLLNDQKTISSENIAAIKKWQAEGNCLLVASGRPHFYFEQLISLGVEPEYMICGSGSALISRKDGLEFLAEMKHDIASELMDYLDARDDADYQVDSVSEGSIFGNFANGYFNDHIKGEISSRRNIRPSKDIFQLPEFHIYKLFLVARSDEDAIRIKDEIEKRWGKGIRAMHSDIRCLEIIPSDCDKWHAIKTVCQRLGITKQNIAAIGDEENDIAMITNAKLGFAMINAKKEVKEVGDHIVGGVAEAINIVERINKMKYPFDVKTNRLNTSSTKWDRYKSRYGMDDVIPLWVADMDFETVPEVNEAMIKRAKHGIFGYTDASEELFEAIINWEKRHHDVDITKDNIVLNTGVVYGLYELIGMLVKEDEKVIVQPPVYPPLFNTPLFLDRKVIYSSLIKKGQHWELDLAGFEKALDDNPDIKLYIMCNPHNPTGNCFTVEELNALFEICYQHNVWVVSDEIHGDLIMPSHKHYSALCSDEKYHDHLIVLAAPTKTFNLAGMKISYALTKNQEFQKQFAAKAKASGLSSINIFGFEALIAAFNHGDEWLKECITYIYDNFLYLDKYLKENLPAIKFSIPQATYLGWLDLSAYDLPDDYFDRLKFDAKVEFNPGAAFDPSYSSYIRINLACHRDTLKEGLARLKNWLDNNAKLK